ncbi:MAG: hypothetical protein IJ343_08060 [Clostridia bacterium]|nr:hypothetical protein [Clostridia bacterium]
MAGAVYEVFSHGVWSGWMVYAFLFPLVLGALPFCALALRGRPLPCQWTRNLLHAGVATLTVGSFMEGVLAIYGTTNQLTFVYWIVGSGLVLGGFLLSFLRRKAS